VLLASDSSGRGRDLFQVNVKYIILGIKNNMF
jgi:hypothetical protein